MKADVVIIGAGVSGVPAAAAAARCGAKTLLIEKRSAPGGTMSAGLGFPVCGLFEQNPNEPPRLLNGGLSAELFDAVSREVENPVIKMGRVYVCSCPLPLFESVYSRWLDHENLTVFFSIQDWSVEVADSGIRRICFQTSDGTQHHCEAKQMIDCTGTGELIRQSGAEQIVPERLPLAGFCVRLDNVLCDELLPVRVPYLLRRAADAGTLPSFCAFTVFAPTGQGGAICKFNLPDGTSAPDAEQTARSAVRVLKEGLPQLAGAVISRCSPAVLLREESRLKGRVVLDADHIRTGRACEDAAARGGWPMEYWDAAAGPQYEYIETGVAYDIPRGVLQSANIRNLWAAGRAVSADSPALASVRVMGTAIATGEAAGRAAAEEAL
jgi:hypothetical protein